MKYTNKTLITLAFIIFFAHTLSAQSWQYISSVNIPVGGSESSLSDSGEGENSWKPLFFDIDSTGQFVFPDYYKGKILYFSSTGKYNKSISASGIVSPRMNFFALNPSGKIIVFNDSVLNCLNVDGSIVWQAPFPMFVMPEAIIALNDAAYFMISDDSGKKLGFKIDYSEKAALAQAESNTQIPSFNLNGTALSFTAQLMRALKNIPSTDTISWLPKSPQARFLCLGAKGTTVWSVNNGSILSIYVLDAAGKLLSESTIDSKSLSDWTWPVVKLNKEIFTLYLYCDAGKSIDIKKYEFR